jgi:serine/threonine-protein kinase RsbW
MKRESWLPATPESAPRARTLVREAAAELGIPGSAVWDLMLATTEAVANAIEHGRACHGAHGVACATSGAGILLCIEPRDDGLCVEVCDCGSFRSVPAPMDPMSVRGRGIPLIAALVDQLELLAGGDQTRVRFVKRHAAA